MKSRLLKKLPPFFNTILSPERAPAVEKLWMAFGEVLDAVNKAEHTDHQVNDLHEKAKNWAKMLVIMAGTGPGYLQDTIITPYPHLGIPCSHHDQDAWIIEKLKWSRCREEQ